MPIRLRHWLRVKRRRIREVFWRRSIPSLPVVLNRIHGTGVADSSLQYSICFDELRAVIDLFEQTLTAYLSHLQYEAIMKHFSNPALIPLVLVTALASTANAQAPWYVPKGVGAPNMSPQLMGNGFRGVTPNGVIPANRFGPLQGGAGGTNPFGNGPLNGINGPTNPNGNGPLNGINGPTNPNGNGPLNGINGVTNANGNGPLNGVNSVNGYAGGPFGLDGSGGLDYTGLAASGIAYGTYSGMGAAGGFSGYGSSGGYYGGGGGFTQDPISAYANAEYSGISNMIRAQGQHEKDNSEAMINQERARTVYLDNRQRAFYSQLRRRAIAARHQLAQEEHDKRVERNQRVEAFLAAHQPTPLEHRHLDPWTGDINWPTALQADDFADQRQTLESLFARHVQSRYASDASEEIATSVREMKDLLRSKILDLPPNQYSDARKFLDRMAVSGRMNSKVAESNGG